MSVFLKSLSNFKNISEIIILLVCAALVATGTVSGIWRWTTVVLGALSALSVATAVFTIWRHYDFISAIHEDIEDLKKESA